MCKVKNKIETTKKFATKLHNHFWFWIGVGAFPPPHFRVLSQLWSSLHVPPFPFWIGVYS
jgi:hypothetical protein